MITENLSTLKIHKLSQTQYDRELANGRIEENALYLTPDEDYVSRSEFEALLARVEALENGGGGISSPLVINVSQYGSSSGTPWNLYINGEVVESFSDSIDSSDNGTFTYENVNSAFIKIPDSAMTFLGGYMTINGTMIYEYGTNHLLSIDGIYSLPTSGTVNIEYQVMD